MGPGRFLCHGRFQRESMLNVCGGKCQGVTDSVQRLASGEVRHQNNAPARLHCMVRPAGGQKLRTHVSEGSSDLKVLAALLAQSTRTSLARWGFDCIV